MLESRAVAAGLLYCGVVFAAGMVLGAIRMLWVAPLAGELVAVAVEAPVMLAISWAACAWAAERLEVSDQFLDRLIMGGVALAALIGAEAATALLLGGRSLQDYVQSYGQSAALLGLMAQLVFAVFPVLRRRPRG